MQSRGRSRTGAATTPINDHEPLNKAARSRPSVSPPLHEEAATPRQILQHAQVLLHLPGRELNAVVVPLLALQLDIAVEDVLAERAADEVRAGELVDRLTKRLRKADDAALAALLGRQVIEVLLHRRRQVVALLDPLESRMEKSREGEVRVARRIGTANLRTRRLLVPGLVERDPDEGRAVAARPRDVDGSLVARHEPLVGVDPLGEDRRDLAGMVELTSDEGLADIREVPLVVRVEEGVVSVGEEGLVRVHPRAVLAEER